VFTQPTATAAVAAAPPAVHPAEDATRRTLTDLITQAAANTPRSRQKRIGPSEVGHPCPRHIAYKWLNMPAANSGGDPWPSIVGTAAHAWIADALEAHNQQLGRTRWLVEQRVQVTGYLAGSCDAYDLDTNTVIDHKVVGPTMLAKYKAQGVREQYRIQAHLYGQGWANAGHTPRRVQLVFYHRNGRLDDMWVWGEDYSPTIAQRAVERLERIYDLANQLRVDEHPAHWAHIPATPGDDCRYCPWWLPASTNLARGCPGTVTNPTQIGHPAT